MHFKKGNYYIYKKSNIIYVFKYINFVVNDEHNIKLHHVLVLKYDNNPFYNGKIDIFNDNSLLSKHCKEISEKEALIWAL